MTYVKDLFVQLTTDTSAFDQACEAATISLEDLKLAMDSLRLQPYQVQMITTAASANSFYDAWRSGLREGEITMELKMSSTDPFDPFKVEAGCAHPDDYREPLPYYGAPPSDDEWLCSACGYWRKGAAFGVTPLPQPEPLTDAELDELLEKQSKRSVSQRDFRDQWLGNFDSYETIAADLAVGNSFTASFPISYPRLPMPNSAMSHNSIKALMHELEDRNRQKAHLMYSPDLTLSPSAGAITELRLIMQYNDRSTPIKAVIDGLYTVESVGKMFVRSSEQHFEAHPAVIRDLAREFLTAVGPGVTPQPTLAGMALQWKLLGYGLQEQRMYSPGTISMAFT